MLSKAGELKSQVARDREDQQLVMTAQVQNASAKAGKSQESPGSSKESGFQEPRKADATQAARLDPRWFAWGGRANAERGYGEHIYAAAY